MPTVINSLVVELGLDPSKLTKGQQEAVASFKKSQEAIKKEGEQIEKHASGMTEAFSTLGRTVLGVGSILMGGRGIKQFATEIIASDDAMGRLAYRLNTTTEKFSRWEQAVRLAGGSKEGFTASVKGLMQDLKIFELTGASNVIGTFRSLGVVIADDKGKLLDVFDIMKNITKAVDERKVDPATAATLLGMAGVDEGTANLMIRGSKVQDEYLEKSRKLGEVLQENANQSRKMVESFTALEIAAANVGRKIASWFSPFIVKMLDTMTKDAMGEGRKGALLKEFRETPKQSYWEALKRGLKWTSLEPDVPAAPAATGAGPGGAFSGAAEKEAFIRAEAARRGIDPSVAMRVARSEGFDSFNSSIPGEKSYGAFQLNISRDPSRPSLGDRFKSDTGLDPADPTTEREGIKYALDEARRKGWGQWYGARNTGISNFEGIPRTADAGGGPVNNSRTATTTIGNVNVYTQATDAAGIARDMKAAVERNSLADQAQTGPN